MIKSEEARQIVSQIVGVDNKIMLRYISQQEKVNELLELYQKKEQQLIYDAKVVLSQSKRKELLEEYYSICSKYYICGIEDKEQIRRQEIEKQLDSIKGSEKDE